MCALLLGAMGFLHRVEEIIFYLPESPPNKCERFCCIIKACLDFQRWIRSFFYIHMLDQETCFFISLTNA